MSVNVDATGQETRRLNVLLVDDDQDDTTIFKKLISHLRDFRVDFTWTSDSRNALELIRSRHFDLHFIDYRLGRESGLELIRTALQDDPCKAFVVVTGAGNEELAAESFRCGAVDYLPKNGLDRSELDRCIRHSMNESTTRARQLRALQESLFDGLTGVYARDAFLDAARREFSRSYAGRHSYALMIVDIDDFHKANEAHGRAVGDEMLREVGFNLREAVLPGDLAGRDRDDRFLVLMRVDSREEAKSFGEMLRESIGRQTRVTVSIGIAIESANMCYLNTLIAHATIALEQAKQKRNSTEIWQK